MTIAVVFIFLLVVASYTVSAGYPYIFPVSQKKELLPLEERMLALEAEDAKLDKQIAALEANETLVKDISSDEIREELREKLRNLK